MGLHPKLVGPLEARLDLYATKGADLWSKISKIAQELGTQEKTQGSDYTIITHELLFRHDRSVCKIESSSYRYGSQYLSVIADGEKVLFVTEKDKRDYETATEVDRKRMVLIQDRYFKVEAYIPGDWESWLDLDMIKATLEAKNNEDIREAAARRKAEEENRPFSEEEIKIARSFGFPTR